MLTNYKWKTVKQPTCSLWTTTIDDDDHFLRYQRIDIVQVCETGFKNIQSKMYDTHTKLELIHALVHLL